jgi:predicted PhzF superfamily epimerase YddE/YHI9
VARRDDEVVQQCGVGLVRIRRDGARLAFAAPPLLRSGPLEPELLARIVRGLDLRDGEVLDHQWVDNGPGWAAVRLASAGRVLQLKPDYAALRGIKLGVVAPHAAGSDAQFEVRALIGEASGYEDPVTGSLNASLAQWLIGGGVAPEHYVAAQGAALQRAGRVHVRKVGADIWIGGDVCTVVAGTVLL